MTVREQLVQMNDCLNTLKEIQPRHIVREEKEDFLSWINRGLTSGLLTKEEHEVLTRIFVYGKEELELSGY